MLRYLAIGSGALVLTVASFLNALVGSTAGTMPALALRIAPTDALAASTEATRLLQSGDQAQLARIKQLSRTSLHAQALNPAALATMAYASTAMLPHARQLADLSERLSRRNFVAQVWLIEDDVRRGRLEGALAHYDTALRTSVNAPLVLFPPLADALQDLQVRTAFVPYVKQNPPWLLEFARFAIDDDRFLITLTKLWHDADGFPPTPIMRQQEQRLMTRLAATEHFAAVAAIFLRRPGSDPRRLTSPAFESAGQSGDIVAWQTITQPNSGSTLAYDGDNPSLIVFSTTEDRATVARKLLFLRPATYRFRSSVEPLSGQRDGVGLQIKCADVPDQPVISRADSANNTINMTVMVPANCKTQYLDVIANGTDSALGFKARLHFIEMKSDQAMAS